MPRNPVLQVAILLWFKEIKRMWRTKVSTLVALVYPIAVSAMIIAVFVTQVPGTASSLPSYNRTQPISWMAQEDDDGASTTDRLFYTSNVEGIAEVVLHLYHGDSARMKAQSRAFATYADMEKAIYSAGHVSPNTDYTLTLREDSGQFTYTVQTTMSDLTAPAARSVPLPAYMTSTGWGYNEKGILDFQMRLADGLRLVAGTEGHRELNATVQRYPRDPSAGDGKKERYTVARKGPWRKLGALWFAACYLLTVPGTVGIIVRDKEYRLRQSLQTVGVSGSAYRFTYAVRGAILHGTATLFPFLLYQALGLFYSSHVGLLYMCSVVLVMTATYMASLLALLFSQARLAPIMSLLAFSLCACIGALVTLGATDAVSSRLAACLLPPSALVVFFTSVFELENSGDGLVASTLATRANGYPAPIEILAVSVVSAVLFEFLAYYFEQVLPGVLGAARPWYFPFQALAKWRSPRIAVQQNDVEEGHKAAILSARGLRKTFGNVVAVNRVNIDVYQGEVLSLLGHNGAGKSTTVNMLTGTLHPTEGTIVCQGEDTSSDGLSRIRNITGVCPQHDILFDQLTTRDHLMLMGALKGVSLRELGKVVSAALEEVGVADKGNARATSLSGGQKRKMSVAMAFLGGSKLVLLDEPTSGMDPASRRHLWSVVERRKATCAVILTTHFMDEADLLGDRIAIMHQGTVQACGTGLELKKAYGRGYTLIADLSQPAGPTTELIRQYDPEVTILSQHGGEVVYQLSQTADGRLADLLDNLALKKEQLGVVNHGLTMTTLEEVFLRLEEEAQQAEGKVKEDLDMSAIEVTGKGLSFMRTLRALLYKRMCCAKKDKQGMAFIFGLPFIFLIIGVIGREVINRNSSSPAVHLLSHDDIPTGALVGTVDSDMEREAQGMLAPPFNTSWVRLEDIPRLINPTSSHASSVAMEVELLNATAVAANVLFNASVSHALPTFFHSLAFGAAGLHNVVGTLQAMPPSQYTAGMAGDMVFLSTVVIALAFVPSAYASFVVRERETGSANLQYASGVTQFQYWLTTVVVDSVWTLAACGVFTVLLTPITTGFPLWCLFLSLLLYTFTTSFLAYILSFHFDKFSKAQTGIASLLIFFGFNFLIADLAVSASSGSASSAARVVGIVFASICPLFGVVKCVMIAIDFLGMQSVHSDGLLAYNQMGLYHAILLYQLVGYVTLMVLLLLPWRAWFLACSLMWHNRANDPSQGMEVMPETEPLVTGIQDRGVMRERQRILSGVSDNAMYVRGLRKVYKDVVAVDNLYLGVAKGECFGLLGSNGAGKTTTIRMLTCEEPPTAGYALIMGRNVLTSGVRRELGLCPQFDALLGEMSGRETIRFYAMIKGVPDDVVDNMVRLVDLQQHADKPCGSYSGGNKRKLSVALALLGAPSVIFLDEPTTGVDPKARRGLWNLIKEAAKKRTVVLTSHSMEEVDALCSRIAIMAHGKMQCVGTPMELRAMMNCGYTVQVSCRNAQLESALAKLQERVVGMEVVEKHSRRVVFSTPPSTLPSDLLRLLRQLSEESQLDEYAISQTTLEQVFLHVVSE